MARLLPTFGIDISVITSGNHIEQMIVNENVISIQSNEFTGGNVELIIRKIKNLIQRFIGYDGALTKWERIALEQSNRIIELTRPDIILCSYPPMYAIRLGIMLAEYTNIPLVSDFRDSFLINPLETDLINKTSNKYIYYYKLNEQVKSLSKLITAASTDIAEAFKTGGAHEVVEVIYNGFDGTKKYKIIDCFDGNVINVLHTGRIALSERGTSIIGFISGLIKALSINPKISKIIRFHFVGSLTLFERVLLSPFAILGVVKIWGVVDREIALSMQESADVLFLITKPNAKNAISGKLIEYLRLNKPIFALTSGSEAELILDKTRLGLVVPPDSPSQICELILKMCKNRPTVGGAETNVINEFRDTELIRKLAVLLRDLR